MGHSPFLRALLIGLLVAAASVVITKAASTSGASSPNADIIPTSLVPSSSLIDGCSGHGRPADCPKFDVMLQATIFNLGEASESNVQVQFAYSTDEGESFTDIQQPGDVGTISIGGTTVATLTWPDVPHSNYLVKTHVDPGNLIDEADETNNVLLSAILVPSTVVGQGLRDTSHIPMAGPGDSHHPSILGPDQALPQSCSKDIDTSSTIQGVTFVAAQDNLICTNADLDAYISHGGVPYVVQAGGAIDPSAAWIHTDLSNPFNPMIIGTFLWANPSTTSPDLKHFKQGNRDYIALALERVSFLPGANAEWPCST